MFFTPLLPRPSTPSESIEVGGNLESIPPDAVFISDRSLRELLVFSDMPLAEHKEYPQLTWWSACDSRRRVPESIGIDTVKLNAGVI